jgi:integrase/recombinase XerC
VVTIRKFEKLQLIRSESTPYLIARWTVDRRRQRSTKETRVEAAWVEAQRLYQEAKLRAKGDEPEPTLSRLVELWIQAHALRKSRSHIENMERWGRLHLGPMSSMLISTISTAVVEAELGIFLKDHAKSYGNQWLTYLRIVFRWALKRRMIRIIPWEVEELKVKQKPRPRLPEGKASAWLEEVDRLTEHEPAIALVIRLMVGLGLRCSEACHARWEWLSLEGEAETYTPGDTKGGEAWPRPIPAWLAQDLSHGSGQIGHMIPTREGGLVTPGRIQRVMDLACEAVDIVRLTPHKLRHSYATWLSEEGVPIQDIQAMLGHKDIKTTAIYLGVDLSRVRRAQGRLADRLQIKWRNSGAALSGEAV